MKWKYAYLIGALIATLLLVAAAWAQTPGATVWEATYWNNTSLDGEPALTRTEDVLAHDWGRSSPAPGVTADNFSARWTTSVNLPQGRYLFTATVDDGIRLWVDDLLLINNWAVQPPHTLDAEIEIDGGVTPIRVEYFDQSGPAIVEVSWAPLEVTSSTWYAEYFDNRFLRGRPVIIRNVPAISFDWGESSPAPDVLHPDIFSARWRRTIDVQNGVYRFVLTVDDGARLWVDGDLLIDAWQPQPATRYEADVRLQAGDVPLRLEYYENGGLAQINLNWVRLPEQQPAATPPPSPPAQPPPSPPPGASNVLVDSGSAGFLRGGRPTEDWQQVNVGYGGSSLWTNNSDRLPTAYNWAQWQPALEPGRYEVVVHIPPQFPTTRQARYWISHDTDFTLRVVDQLATRGSWVSLGTFQFDGVDDYVSLADVTFEEEGSTVVGYDAVGWLARE